MILNFQEKDKTQVQWVKEVCEDLKNNVESGRQEDVGDKEVFRKQKCGCGGCVRGETKGNKKVGYSQKKTGLQARENEGVLAEKEGTSEVKQVV